MKILDKLTNAKMAVGSAMTTLAMTMDKPKKITSKEEAIDYVKSNTGHYATYTLDPEYRDGMYDDGDRQEFIPSIAYLPEEFKNDKEVILAAVETDYRTYDKISDTLKQDPDIIEAYNKHNIIEVLGDIDNYVTTTEPTNTFEVVSENYYVQEDDKLAQNNEIANNPEAVPSLKASSIVGIDNQLIQNNEMANNPEAEPLLKASSYEYEESELIDNNLEEFAELEKAINADETLSEEERRQKLDQLYKKFDTFRDNHQEKQGRKSR